MPEHALSNGEIVGGQGGKAKRGTNCKEANFKDQKFQAAAAVEHAVIVIVRMAHLHPLWTLIGLGEDSHR